MRHWFPHILSFLSSHYRAVLAVTGVTLMGMVDRWIALRAYLRRRILKKRSSARFFATNEIHAATDNYLEPRVLEGYSGAQRPSVPSTRLFKRMDQLLSEGGLTFLLAETGMGKTAALLNYFARHYRRLRKEFDLFIIPLERKTAFDEIQEASKSPSALPKVLLLDAFDEDTLALATASCSGDPLTARAAREKRLMELAETVERFQHVLITCRTQFFDDEDEVRHGTAEWRCVGSINLGGSKKTPAKVLYLSPFSDAEAQQYIAQRFPFWRFWLLGKRADANKVLGLCGEMGIRPLILSYIEYLLSLEDPLEYPCQAYERIVEAWLERDHGKRVDGKGELLDAHKNFCEALAVDIFQKRKSRQDWTVTQKKLELLAAKFEVSLPDIMDSIRVRSLLSRDPQGGIRFAHSSILEYFYVRHFRRHRPVMQEVGWTDEMKRFYVQMLFEDWKQSEPKKQLPADEYDLSDLSGLLELKIPPLRQLRSEPTDNTAEILKLARQVEGDALDSGLPHLYEEAEQAPHSKESYYTIEKIVQSTIPKDDYSAPISHDLVDETVQDILNTVHSGSRIIIDHATGLAWEVPGSRRPARFPLAGARSAVLRTIKFGGFSGWRLPTIEEISVLVHLYHYEPLCEIWRAHAFGRKAGLQPNVWTADRAGLSNFLINLNSKHLSSKLHASAYGVCVTSL